MKEKKILIFGVTGMLGSDLYYQFSKNKNFSTYATARNKKGLEKYFNDFLMNNIIDNIDADNFDSIIKVLNNIKPDIAINCIGIIKQLPIANDPITAITINSLLPHKIAKICNDIGARMIHISTDCVFDGKKGNYTEDDFSNAEDLYGKSKFLGEVNYPNCITLRTSIIGHELKSKYGLVEWFLSQENPVKGFTKAIYTGFPTIEIARIISEFVIPNEKLIGLYQVSSNPISKYELLKIISQKYNKKIEIIPFDDFFLDRSLDSSKFKKISGYKSPSWVELIDKMYYNHVEN
jgi:dTDP-4-dehydrorhamnose reductase